MTSKNLYEKFIVNSKDKNAICPMGNKSVKAEFIQSKNQYLLKFDLNSCKKCDYLKQCPVKIKNQFAVVKVTNHQMTENKDYIQGMQLGDAFKKKLDKEISYAIKQGEIFKGYNQLSNTNMSTHKAGINQRESILCFLDNIKLLTDTGYTENDIYNGMTIYLHNIEVTLDKKLHVNNLNKGEVKLLNKTCEDIRSILNEIKQIQNTKDKVYKLFDIRKLVTMIYTAIFYNCITKDYEKLAVEAFVDENFTTHFVIVNEANNSNEADIIFNWYYYMRNDIPLVVERLAERKNDQMNAKYGKEYSLLKDSYMESCKCIENKEFNKAEELLFEIINQDKIYDFTSGAYVNFAVVKLNKSGIEKLNEYKDEIEGYLYKALEIKPSNTQAPANLIALYVALGDFNNALAWLDKCNNETVLENLKITLSSQLEYVTYLMTLDYDYNQRLNTKTAYIFFTKLKEIYHDIEENLEFQLFMANYFVLREEEGLLKAYDIYKSIINKFPDSFLGYLKLSELCGNGNLNRPLEQEEYCLKAIELIDKHAKDNNEQIKLQIEKCKIVAEMNLIGSWIQQKRFDEVLKITKERIQKNPNNTDIHNHALALHYVGMYEESLSYCNRELFVCEDETIYLLIAMNFYAMKDYPMAIEYYRKSLEFISEDKLGIHYIDENGQQLFSYTKESWQKNKLKEIYIPLVDSYFKIEDYINAKAIWMMAKNTFPNDTAINAWENVINITLKDKKQLELAETQYTRLLADIEEERKINIKKTAVVRKWAIDLMKLQGIYDNSIINDDNWDNFEKSLDVIIKKMIDEIQNKEEFSSIKEKFKSIYPNLDPISVEFIATAEYLYIYNKDSVIDFAPIMVEYCKSIELELRIILKNDSLMLGQSLNYINKFKAKPLIDIYPALNEIYLNRNGSAHVGLSNRQKVDKVREFLFNKGVLKTISDIKK